MPHETTWEAHGICQKFRGTLSSPELLAALGEIQGDPRIKSLRYVIRDFRAVDVVDLGIKPLLEGRAWIAAMTDRLPDIVFAVITTSPELFALLKAASSYGLDACPFAIFPNEEETRAWIAGFEAKRR